VLLLMLHATVGQFRTGWFVESVVSATIVVLVIRTRKPFFVSRPGKYLFAATLGVLAVVMYIPYSPLAPVFGFEPISAVFMLLMAGIVLLYIGTAEVAKKIFYRVVKF
jgi:P-type Mg2+ transporter